MEGVCGCVGGGERYPYGASFLHGSWRGFLDVVIDTYPSDKQASLPNTIFTKHNEIHKERVCSWWVNELGTPAEAVHGANKGMG